MSLSRAIKLNSMFKTAFFFLVSFKHKHATRNVSLTNLLSISYRFSMHRYPNKKDFSSDLMK